MFYHVDRLSDTPDSAVRMVQAKQGNKPVFSATLNFTRVDAASRDEGEANRMDHDPPMPDVEPPEDVESGWDSERPFQSQGAEYINRTPSPPFPSDVIISLQKQRNLKTQSPKKSANGPAPVVPFLPKQANKPI